MAVDLRGKGMRSYRLRSREEVDPMSSMANLADVMLVFACGLMMALVTLFNVDFTAFSELEDDQMEAIEEPGDLPEELLSGGSAYVEKGMVYQDPSTGKYYMLASDAEGMNADLESQGASGSDGSGAAGSDAGSGSSSGSGTDTGSSSGSGAGASSGSGTGASGGNRVSAGATVPDRSAGAD